MSYWDNFYKNNTPETTPWTGVQNIFFEKIWEKFELPKSGNFLDVGCGRGDKSIYFSELGFDVWGFDISQTAIEEAKKKSKKVTFFRQDASEVGLSKEIDGIKFDVILDLVTSQFLDKNNKQTYLEGLKNHIKPKETYYLMTTFVKESDDDKMLEYPDWVKKIAQSPRDIEETYLQDFEILDSSIRETPKGKVGTYIFKSK